MDAILNSVLSIAEVYGMLPVASVGMLLGLLASILGVLSLPDNQV